MVSNTLLSPRSLYHRLSFQNHLAAVTIQKFVRGVQTRNLLWHYERFGSAGFLFIEKVVKTIQRYFRGYLVRIFIHFSSLIYNDYFSRVDKKLQQYISVKLTCTHIECKVYSLFGAIRDES